MKNKPEDIKIIIAIKDKCLERLWHENSNIFNYKEIVK